MSDYRLGKKVITDPEVTEVVDEYEPFIGSHGTHMRRNKRTGAIETDQTPKGPQFPPYIPGGVPRGWEAVAEALRKALGATNTPPPPEVSIDIWAWGSLLQKQEDDGFPLNEFGVM